MEKKASEEGQKALWKDISDFLNYWYYRPDIHALEICLSVFATHTRLKEPPVWLFVVGPSGTGKTDIVCKALKCLPDVFEKSDISANSFISGRATKVGGSSLLFNLPKIGKEPNRTQGVIVFKDFSSILTKRPEIKAEVMSQLREIHDGSYAPVKGTKTMDWSGKVTVIAACTPTLERHWSVQRELGERFVQVRWPREDGVEIGFKSFDASNKGDSITEKFQSMIKRFMNTSTLLSTDIKVLPPSYDFVYLGEMAAVLRGSVVRDNRGIVDIPPCEAPSRLVKAMLQICIGHMMIFRREVPNEDDIKAGRRIGIDSIPYNRLGVISAIGQGYDQVSSIVEHSNLAFSIVDYVLEDLIALGIVAYTRTKYKQYSFSPWFIKLRNKALKIPDNVVSIKGDKNG